MSRKNFFILGWIFTLVWLGACQATTADIVTPHPTRTAIAAIIEDGLSQALSTPTSEPSVTPIVEMTTATPSSTPTIVPSPSSTPNTSLIDGLIFHSGDFISFFIVKSGQMEPLSYEDILSLEANASILGMAISSDNRVFRLAEPTGAGQQLVTINSQVGDQEEIFFSDERYQDPYIYGIVGEWLIVRLVLRDLPPDQPIDDLIAIALDGSRMEIIGQNTHFTPIVAPDQSYVIFDEGDGVVKRWLPDNTTEILSLPSYQLGVISNDNRYIALVDSEDLVTIYDLNSFDAVVSDQSAEGYMWPGSIIWNPMSDGIIYNDPYRDQSNDLFLRAVYLDGQTETYKDFASPVFSPDGSHMVVLQNEGSEMALKIVDLSTGIQTTVQMPSPRPYEFYPIYWLDSNEEE